MAACTMLEGQGSGRDGEGVDGAVAGQQECLVRLAGRRGGQHAYAVYQRAAVGARRAREGHGPGPGYSHPAATHCGRAMAATHCGRAMRARRLHPSIRTSHPAGLLPGQTGPGSGFAPRWPRSDAARPGAPRARRIQRATGIDAASPGRGPLSRHTHRRHFRRLAGRGDLVPQPAVQVEPVAVGLAAGGVADVGVQGMPVVGGLDRPV